MWSDAYFHSTLLVFLYIFSAQLNMGRIFCVIHQVQCYGDFVRPFIRKTNFSCKHISLLMIEEVEKSCRIYIGHNTQYFKLQCSSRLIEVIVRGQLLNLMYFDCTIFHDWFFWCYLINLLNWTKDVFNFPGKFLLPATPKI